MKSVGDCHRTPARRMPIPLAGLLLLLCTFALGQEDRRVVIGGWGGVGYFDDEREGTLRTFDAHPFYLYFSAKPKPGWSFFGEFEGEHLFKFEGGKAVEGEGEFFIERLYVERNFSTKHNIRGGKFIMPFGYWYRLHWRFLTPQYSRPISFNNSFAPQFQVGLKYWGRQATGNSEWEYHAWVGDGPDQFGTNKRSVEDFGYGGSLFFNHDFGGTRDVTFGATLGVHTQTVATGEVTGNEENLVFGAELRMTGFELMGEYFHHELERAGDDPFLLEANEYSTWYLSALAWFTPSVGVLYRYDFGDDPKTAKETLDPETTYHNLGLIYRPNARVQIRLEYNIREFKDPALVEYNSWLAWWGIKF